MTVREELLIAFAEEVLGPRKADPRERFTDKQDPQYEYIVGILSPKDARGTAEPDRLEAQATARRPETPKEGFQAFTNEEDEEEDESEAAAQSDAPLALNARGQPASIGLSVVVRGKNGTPRIALCCTWARYKPDATGWTRDPRSFVAKELVPSDGLEERPPSDPYVRILIRTNKLPDGSHRLTVFLVNETPVASDHHGKRPPTSAHIFQPQIRIRALDDTDLRPLDPRAVSKDDESLALLYRERKTFARGHLCSATWGSVDPQRPYGDTPPIVSQPFGWPDGNTLEPADREFFEPKHGSIRGELTARTEFLPLYAIEAPHIAWDPKYGLAPELRASELAEKATAQEVRIALEPLAQGYAKWLDEKRRNVSSLGEHEAAARRHVADLDAALGRIRKGIRTLERDEDARLAFCFMNKAMDLQAAWAKRTHADGRTPGLEWRPFQLAFVLHAIEGIVDEKSEERDILDLLWFPTGGGKTEAYLGLTILTMALRRRTAVRAKSPDHGAGVGVISRYTLRLLTIQQFRRALSAITAADYLRVLQMGRTGIGWRPKIHEPKETFLWGGERFSIGLWVGDTVTPNNLETFTFRNEDGGFETVYGAVDILRGKDGRGEPAQILNCPACNAILAVPNTGLDPGEHVLHYLVTLPDTAAFERTKIQHPRVEILDASAARLGGDLAIITLRFRLMGTMKPGDFDDWVINSFARATAHKARIESARPSRPGYFLITHPGSKQPKDFETICVAPDCPTASSRWFETVPIGTDSKGGTKYAEVPPLKAFRRGDGKMRGLPISGFVVDDQVYHRCPSMLIATVDKFARLAYEPKAASLFGNVDYYHSHFGYYREGCPPGKGQSPHPAARGCIPTAQFRPPTLIIQDELHLIEGPLGSMVGLYETALDILSTRHSPDGIPVRPKYVASTATIRAAQTQVQAIFDRKVAQFPPSGLDADDSFFARTREIHQRDELNPGRLYVGFAAPGKGSQTPVIRTWASLLQRAYELRAGASNEDVDPYWTLVGYFNAIKELARATGLCRIDIPQWVDAIHERNGTPRRVMDDQLELSSRAESHVLPSLLTRVATSLPKSAVDVVLATSMFGTGVDVDRLGLMFLHSQPKTTSAYIQSTGRIGRKKAGLVITFLGAGRPRDLAHYEFFVGYHRAIQRSVEPVTVAPYSPRARERGLGPLAVVLLRNARSIGLTPVPAAWAIEQRGEPYLTHAPDMAARRHAPEVKAIIDALEARARSQPEGRQPLPNAVKNEAAGEMDKWQKLAQNSLSPDGLVYFEPTMAKRPRRNVVLGDPAHALKNLKCAFKNSPQSLREVEKTLRVEVK